MTVLVVAPSPQLTVTIESGDEIHLHAGGQGVWAARMLTELDVPTSLCCALGGESGFVLAAVLAEEDAHLETRRITASNGVYIHDRRNGERHEIAAMPAAEWARHDLDEWYGMAYTRALKAKVVVLTGTEPSDVVPADTYRRLTSDLRKQDVVVIADLSGDAMDAALEGGLDVLKVSETEIAGDQSLEDRMLKLRERASIVIATRKAESALVAGPESWFEVRGPKVDPVDPRGAGDSFLAGLTAGLHSGLGLPEALQLGWAAGTINSTRHGLGTGRGEDVREMASHVTVEPRPYE